MPLTGCRFVLSAVLALSLVGCVTRQFVRAEITRSEAALRPTVERLARDLREHQTEMREIAVQVADAARGGEEATRAAIEALGVADVAAGRAAEAVDQATIALTRADEASIAGEQALAEAEGTAEQLARLWLGRVRLAVVEAIVLQFRVDEWVLDDQARGTLLDIAKRLRETPALVVELEGTWAYDRFVEHVTARSDGWEPGEQYVPHPALRRR